MHEDLSLWYKILQDFNGQVYFLDSAWTLDTVLQLFTESSGASNLGCGAYIQGQCCYLGWSSLWQNALGDMTF